MVFKSEIKLSAHVISSHDNDRGGGLENEIALIKY